MRALYHRAVGYEQEEVKIFMPAGAKKAVLVPFTAKIAPDTSAAIFWLKNRRPDEWRDKQDIQHGGEIVNKVEVSARDRIARRLAGIAARADQIGDSGEPE